MPMLALTNLPETVKEKDLRLLNAWKRAPSGFEKERALSALLDTLSGAIGFAVNTFRNAPLPLSAIELEGKRVAMEACGDYQPGLGTSLATFVTTRVKQRLSRYVGTYQNVARLPEHQIQQIGPLREAMADLTARWNREPTTDELADHMGLPIKHIVRLRKNLRQDLMAESGGLDSIEAFESDPDFEKAHLVYYSLNQSEKQVFDFSMGAHGQPHLSTNDIAARLKISAGRVSQLKQSIADKLQPYMGEKK